MIKCRWCGKETVLSSQGTPECVTHYFLRCSVEAETLIVLKMVSAKYNDAPMTKKKSEELSMRAV